MITFPLLNTLNDNIIFKFIILLVPNENKKGMWVSKQRDISFSESVLEKSLQ